MPINQVTQKVNYTQKFLFILMIITLNISTFRAQAIWTDYNIAPDKVGELSIELDYISFFKDNEFSGPVMKGYTLPGFRLEPKGVFLPLKNIKLELGLHALIYNGAYKYPNYAYQDIAKWKGNQYQRGAHILPYFRAQLKLSKFNLVWGNLYGGSNHNLIEPLYNPELNLTADPETGFQLLYDSKYLHSDIWVNWQSFIFQQDTHQEAFTVGFSSQIKFCRPISQIHYYIPVQMVIQHRGGELDTLYTNSVQTLMNASAGVGVIWNLNHRILKQMNLEVNAIGYYQQAGQLWPLNKGYGLYAQAKANLSHKVQGEVGYLFCKDFISLLGSPYFGAVSFCDKGGVFSVMRTWFLSAEYSRVFKKHFAAGVKVNLYYSCPGTLTYPNGEKTNPGNAASFSFGVHFRANLRFLLSRLSTP